MKCYACGKDFPGRWLFRMYDRDLCDSCAAELDVAIEKYGISKLIAMKQDKADKNKRKAESQVTGQMELC